MLQALQLLIDRRELDSAALGHDLAALGFCDADGAASRICRVVEGPHPAELVAGFLHQLITLLSEIADPDEALIDFERFVHRTDDRVQLFQFLHANPRAIDVMVRLFVSSRYLTETLLRNPNVLQELTSHRRLAELKSREEFFSQALSIAGSAADFTSRMDALRRFQRGEILRIGACDAFGLIDLRSATTQLSLLADSLIQACLTLTSQEFSMPTESLTVIALGKLGGEELNYSSDIDLIFLTDRSPADVLPLAQRLVKALQDSTAEGFLYRVDVRLRPWGRSGELVTTIASYLEYLRLHAELWETQALLKARIVAGHWPWGQEFLQRAEPLIFGASPDDVRASVRQAKNRIESELRRRGRVWGEVKLGMGSIRDIEFVVQALQLVHGARHRHVRTSNTLDGLVRLTDAGILHADEYRRLTDGYVFLRAVEHSLQLMNNRREHSLPSDPRELNALARRLDFETANQLMAHFDGHRESIRKIFDKYISHERALTEPVTAIPIPQRQQIPKRELETYESVFSDNERRRHLELLAEVNETQPVRVIAEVAKGNLNQSLQEQNLWTVTVLGQDCPGEMSMICGLFFAYGFDIIDGFVSTAARTRGDHLRERVSRNFVDVFRLRSSRNEVLPNVWRDYENDLNELVLLGQRGKIDEARGRLAQRVAEVFQETADVSMRPAPFEVRFDNEADDHATVLHIQGEGTIGFLYELSNALTLSGMSIEQVMIRTEDHRAFDTLLVTEIHTGEKITDASRLQELQAAVVLIKQFTHLLPAAANPRAALLHFRAFLRDFFHRPDWLDQLSSLDRPEVLSALAQMLGMSDFLWEDFLRRQYASLFPVLHDISGLRQVYSREYLQGELSRVLGSAHAPDERRRLLNEFKDRELFRINMRYILGYCPEVESFGHEMTDLAEVVIVAAVTFCRTELESRFGSPQMGDGRESTLVLCALGKCGGREMGFASDIELMFVYSADGTTTSETRESNLESIANASFFAKLVESVCQAIDSRKEGVFRIDLRLRPYGRTGSLGVSFEAFRNYFQADGPAWPYERQALVKLRSIGGDEELASRLTTLRNELVYNGNPVDFLAIRAMRERQLRQLVGATEFHAKLSPGGLVDLEYLVQALQMDRGDMYDVLRTTNTRQAIDALFSVGLLSRADHERLRDAYHFLRRVIDAMRMVRGASRDLSVPPQSSADFESLARRLGYGVPISRLHEDVTRHSQVVTELVRLYSKNRKSGM